jgi:hypothetical protein
MGMKSFARACLRAWRWYCAAVKTKPSPNEQDKDGRLGW